MLYIPLDIDYSYITSQIIWKFKLNNMLDFKYNYDLILFLIYFTDAMENG